MAGKVLIFAGAPHSSSLTWDTAELLTEIPEPIARFARLPLPTTVSSASTPTESLGQQHAAWRSIPLEKAKVHSGFTQQGAFNNWQHSQSDFFTTAGVSFMSDDGTGNNHGFTDDLLSQFYEQSRAVHDQVHSSQLVPGSQSTEGASFVTDTSLPSGETSFADKSAKGPIGNHQLIQLSNLDAIPTAAYLTKARPATVTVNLIVGIISLSAPRATKTRWGGTSSLVEVLVGDETRSGFAITFWLPGSGAVDDSELAGLRPQDVVLVQNVALNVFMKKVYGSSLRKSMTKVHLLYRRKLGRDDRGGHYSSRDLASAGEGNPQLDKTRRVREWVLDFVGTGPVGRGGRAQGRPWDKPPEDTQ